MIKNYFTIAWRSLIKNGIFYFINILGLSIGLACCLLIGSYLYSELNYDTTPVHAKQIYRVELHVMGNGSVVDYPLVDVGVGPGMKNNYPEIEACTRLSNYWKPYLRYKETSFKELNIAMADSNFLNVFSIPLLSGKSSTALVEPNTIVVTKAFAKKYFGDEDPLGKALSFGRNGEFKVTGLIDKIPDNYHFHYDAIASLSTFKYPRETWSNLGMYTYLVLDKNADPKKLEAKFPDLVAKYVVPEVQNDMGVSLAEAQKSINTFIFSLQPLSRIHLYSHTTSELEANGDIKYIYIFGALAFFILILACVNFTNLATASSARRAREVGIRKVMGSIKSQLISQFLTESVLLSFCAMVLAYLIVLISLPYFNQLTGRVTLFNFFLEPITLFIVIAGLFLVGIMAGVYPAFFLSSFKTISVLKGNAAQPGRRDKLRSGLVVFQFAVSTALIIATLVVYQQLHFMQNKKLGYDKDQIMVIEDTYTLRNNEKTFKQTLLNDSRVIQATISRQIPGYKGVDGTQAFPKEKKDNENNAEIHIDIFHVDYDYLATLGIQLISGRNLSLSFPSDSSGIVINQTAAREFGWDDNSALNKSIITSGQHEYHVVGVVKDFNYASVREKIAPLVMMLSNNSGSILLKVNASQIPNFISDIKKQWSTLNPDFPFAYSFLDQKFSVLYFAEEKTGRIFSTFAVIALVIAGLGLFGLSAFTAERRTKEIGIRKTMGATSAQVLFMLSRQFLTLVLLAIAIATPIIAWAMNLWLEDFAYRITISWWVFLVGGLLSIVIAFMSMCFQALKAAIANPIESLRIE